MLFLFHGDAMNTPNINLVELTEQFGTDEKCRKALEQLRWKDGAKCPRCDALATPIANRFQYDCDSCHYQFSVTAGTIFQDSHLSLWKWFLAAYLMTESKKGMSANQLKRTLAVSYKTAWYLCHRIRKAMQEVNPPKLRGTVELDETWIGGKKHWRFRTYLRNKTMVVGAIQRGGPVRMKAEKRSKNPSQQIIREFIAEATEPDTQRIYTV